MKAIIFLSFIFFSQVLLAQSIVIADGASIEVGSGADLCAGVFGNITGNLFGNGTQCNQSALLTFQLSVAVTDGWNMVSVPGINPDGQGVSTWWSGRNPLADVYKWTNSYISVTSATPSEGYWMKHIGPLIYNTGDEWPAGGIQIVTHDPIAVLAGWNMIGGYDQSVPIDLLTTTPPDQIVTGTVYGWNGTYYNPPNLEPGHGYWVKVNGTAVINVPTVIIGATPKVIAMENKDDWGKITLTDAAGMSYVLYAVDGKVNLESYQLPPLPPTGMFDVRYSSGKKAEKFDKEMQTIEMRGITYPVKVRVEKMGIRITDETEKIVNERLKSGEEITISNSLVSKLKVTADVIPDKYALEQNYPNPFNPSTKISWQSPVSNWQTLKIYDILGNEVATLVDEYRDAGSYEVDWNASNLSSGVYIYKIQTGNFVETKKLILMK